MKQYVIQYNFFILSYPFLPKNCLLQSTKLISCPTNGYNSQLEKYYFRTTPLFTRREHWSSETRKELSEVTVIAELGSELSSLGPEGHVLLGQFAAHFESLETGMSVRTHTLTALLCLLSPASPGRGCQGRLGSSPEGKWLLVRSSTPGMQGREDRLYVS